MIVTTVEATIRFVGLAVGAISGMIMLGNRFSFSASAFVFAGAFSVLSNGSVATAQYQQTNFPRYSTAPASLDLSREATRAPSFSDSTNDATAMSPNSWGQPAIRNPYAGYQQQTSPIAQRAVATPTQAARVSPTPTTARGDFFAPGTISSKTLPELASDAKTNGSKNSSEAGLKSIMEPLTNTDYSRSAANQTAASVPPTKYPRDRYAQLPNAPGAPDVKFPFTRSQSVEALELFSPGPPSSGPTNSNVPTSLIDALAPDQARDAGSTTRQTIGSPSSLVAPPTISPASSTPIFPTQTLPRQPLPTQTLPGQTLPVQVQAAPTPTSPYFDQSALYASQASGPNSNQWGYGYPESGTGFSEPYAEAPFHVSNHGYGGTTNYGSPNLSYDGGGQSPNIGARSSQPTVRNSSVFDQGELFDHENKKIQYPPFGEIIATGRFFGSAEVALLRPHFLGNTGLSVDGPEFSESIPFEFDNETAPHIRFGFESKYGPGVEFNYFTINANSNPISQTFNGIAPITTIASITGPDRFTRLSADAIGETLDINHSFELETFSVNVFKEIQFKISRLNGQFGFTYANIAQSLEASVTDVGGGVLETLESTSDFRGFGPKFGIEYYRPVGHTPFEFVTSFNGTGLFGRRDQFVNNTSELVQRRFGADEFVTVFDFLSGLQYKKTIAENRSWFARVAFVHQSWLGGGTAVDPQGDFGLKGFTFGVGYNR